MFRKIPNWILKLCGTVNSTAGHVFSNTLPLVRGYERVVGLDELLGA